MKISFFGSSLVSAYWNGACTYYRGIVKGLAARGHEVTFYEPDALDRQAHRDIDDPPWARVVVYPAQDEGQVLSVVEAGAAADVVVKASGVGVFDEVLEAAVLDLTPSRTAVIFWDVDAPATLARLQADPNDALRPLLPRYDIVLTFGGGDPVIDSYRALGARDCIPIYNAADAETHHPVTPAEEFEADLGLLANRLPDRETRVERFFFDAARAAPDGRFLLGGSGWSDHSMPPNVSYVGHVSPAAHNAFNCSPRAVLNVTRDSMAAMGFSPPTRVFEACAAGACLLTDRWLGVEEFFEPEREIIVCTDGREVVDRLTDLAPDHARAIGEAALRRVLADHTYAKRAEQVERVLEGLTSTASAVGG